MANPTVADPDLEKKLADAGLPPGTMVPASSLGQQPTEEPKPEPFTAPGESPLIWAALANAKRDIRAVAKDGKYEQGSTKYNFRGVDAVVNAVSPALARWGISIGFEVQNLERRAFKTKNGGDAVATTGRVEYRFIALDGSVHTVTVEAEANDSADKGTGKFMSVAYRIMLLQVFAIPTHDLDPDAERIEEASPSMSPATSTWLRKMVGNTTLKGLDQLWGLVSLNGAAQERVMADGSGPTWARLFNDRKAELEANRPAPAAGPSGGPE